MVNANLWQKEKDTDGELITYMASCDIRLTVSFENDAESFIERFVNSDRNVDVLVIADIMLKNTDKKRFFESIREVEPNLRVVIIFPGYRNQYVEEQISEYRSKYGVSDIIYEGQKLDKEYFAEVIKKGYIFGCDMNVYDDEMDKSPLMINRNGLSIGVMGLTHGSGVTNMAVNIANYIAMTDDCSVKAIDFSGTGNMRFAQSNNKVIYIVNSDIDVNKILRTSRAVIYDFGTPFDISPKGRLLHTNPCYNEMNMALFRDCDLKICMSFSDNWHAGKIKYLFSDREWRKSIDNSYLFLFDKVSNISVGRFSKLNIMSRNDKEVERRIAGLMRQKRGGFS